LRWLALVLTLGLIVPALTAQDKKDAKDAKDAKDTKDAKEAKDKPETKEKLVTAGTYRGKLERPPGADRTLRLSLPVGRNWKPFPVVVGDDVKVRRMTLPVDFDDKGKPKKYTQKEKDELRGPDKKLPGYTAGLEDLKAGQLIDVYLVRKAGAPKNPKDKDAMAEYEPRASMIVIITDVTTPK
jgi:hypothetical protein